MPLSVASKVFCENILERMNNAIDIVIEDRLRDEQAGYRKFREERSCCDQIATLRVMVEQTFEQNTDYICFFFFLFLLETLRLKCSRRCCGTTGSLRKL